MKKRPEFLKIINVHSDWELFLSGDIRQMLTGIENEIQSSDYTPSDDKALHFLEVPLKSSRVVILGQDPYPQPGVATGRAFEVGNLKSWNEPFRNVSLKNILRALYLSYTGVILDFNRLKEKFDNEFPLLSPPALFKHWEKEGVLLLNTAFTCEPEKSGSHSGIWQEFTSRLLEYIAVNHGNLIWFLWGSHAVEATKNLGLKNSVITRHPMMCYTGPGRENDFLYGKINCFKQLSTEIDWTGYGLKAGFKTTGTLF